MFQKRMKFKAEATAETRLTDRWDQQVFFITKKYPQAEKRIQSIIKAHESKSGSAFLPSEEALAELSELCTELRRTV
jgi:hypothetical protein